MKVKRINTTEGALYGFEVWCPGCERLHVVPVKPGAPHGWDWNGSEGSPTFSPSILLHETRAGEHATLVVPGSILQPVCHSFIRDGKWQFLGDCGHALAGQTVDLPEIPDDRS